MSQRPTASSMLKFAFRLALSALIATISIAQPTQLQARGDEKEEFYFHALVPLGVDAVRIQPLKKTLYLIGSVENQNFEGVHIVRGPHMGRVSHADGSKVTHYPETVEFRVTATTEGSDFVGIDPNLFEVKTKEPMNDYLLGVHFRLKVFHGLNMKVIKPSAVKIIGVPAYSPSDERVYRAMFDTHNIPVEDRMVLEVLDARGILLTRFHLELL